MNKVKRPKGGDERFQKKPSFLKYAGTFHFGSNASDSDGIDEAICDEIEGKLQ